MSHLRISPRYLGQMLFALFCRRCFWYQVQMEFKLPFDHPMPGLMYHMDWFEKQLVQVHFDYHGAFPDWLKELGCTEIVEFPEKMTMEFPEFDITLVGMPDAVFRKKNGRLVLVDYKTAICKGDKDPFLPAYQTQLLGYTHLLESNNIGTVDKAALIYFENELKEPDLNPLELLTSDGFNVPFRATVHDVEINRTELDPLLKQMREFADMRNPPKGREKCPNCARLQKLLDDEVQRRNSEDFARNKSGLARIHSRQLEADRQAAWAGWSDHEVDAADSDLEFQENVPGPMDL